MRPLCSLLHWTDRQKAFCCHHLLHFLLCHTRPPLAGDFALKHASWMVGSQYKPAEVAKMDWEAVKAGPPWAVDSWGLGCMMQVRRAAFVIKGV